MLSYVLTKLSCYSRHLSTCTAHLRNEQHHLQVYRDMTMRRMALKLDLHCWVVFDWDQQCAGLIIRQLDLSSTDRLQTSHWLEYLVSKMHFSCLRFSKNAFYALNASLSLFCVCFLCAFAKIESHPRRDKHRKYRVLKNAFYVKNDFHKNDFRKAHTNSKWAGEAAHRVCSNHELTCISDK